MEKQTGLPSYNEAMMSTPTAPPPDEQSLMHQHQNPYPYQQQPIYPQMPIINQQPLMQPQQIYQPPLSQPQQPQQTVIVINQHIIYGENPVSMYCYHCNSHIVTKTSFENNVINFMLAGILCMMGLWCGCCCLPFCISSIKDVKHQCPKCYTFLGMYRRGRRS